MSIGEGQGEGLGAGGNFQLFHLTEHKCIGKKNEVTAEKMLLFKYFYSSNMAVIGKRGSV